MRILLQYVALTSPYVLLLATEIVAQQPAVVPHAQEKPPGPALSPQEAIAKMTVPAGFQVELVAAEPDIVNPVAMTFDERGRIWITESLEYPRQSPGPGQDRVKVLEDSDGDGRADRFTIFADGLNIPSGIAVGYGGVWVANAPDILFLQDTDGDGRADRREVVVTGFGRSDTHELPNSLTWGPDGWLYGLNGVFNPSRVVHQGREHVFTCVLFRIHPRTREFELFAEGTSNPWGVAWDNEGSAFVSACVIDHLWHLAETGYYHRQGGAYPPFTWKIGSIVQHTHQKAAYCGITFFDSDAYPAEYRERLYMGNIHGNCVNVDQLERDGSTYFGRGRPDFLSANDAWFMPVVQKTGPDGCLYVLDWYDRYHCYQDARRDAAGIDRLKGRLYRVRYQDTPRAKPFDLAQESDAQLIERLRSPNVFYRDVAQRLLSERNDPETRRALASLVQSDSEPRKARMHALWSLIGGGPLAPEFHARLLASGDAGLRAWGVRAAGNMRQVDAVIRDQVVSLAGDPAADVQLQVAIAARKIEGVQPLELLLAVLTHCGQDKLVPQIVWQNLHPLLEERGDEFVALLNSENVRAVPQLDELAPRLVERLLSRQKADAQAALAVVKLLTEEKDALPAAVPCLNLLAARTQSGELAGDSLALLRRDLLPRLGQLSKSQTSAVQLAAAVLAATWKDPAGIEAVREVFASSAEPARRRLQAFEALISADEPAALKLAETTLADQSVPVDFRAAVLSSLGRSDEPAIAAMVLNHYPRMEPELKPRAIELLTQRAMWARPLVEAVAEKRVSADVVNVNQVRRLQDSDDSELVQRVTAIWGTVRTERNPQRELVIAEIRRFLSATPGDPQAGAAVYKKVCAQCHKLYGEGQDVGPDITANGRGSFEQLLSNVLDPSLVIGVNYQARTIATTDGRILTGLLVEDSPQRVVLKMQGGKLETVPRNEVEEFHVSKLSMMPEDLEKQLSRQEMADLFAFLATNKPPEPTGPSSPEAGAGKAP